MNDKRKTLPPPAGYIDQRAADTKVTQEFEIPDLTAIAEQDPRDTIKQLPEHQQVLLQLSRRVRRNGRWSK
jgi:hypothetical protein